MYRVVFAIICVLSTISFHASAQTGNGESQEQGRILFIYPVDKGFPFWDSKVQFAQAIADALGYTLDVAYSPERYRNRFGADVYIKEQVESNPQKPALVLTSFWVGSEEKILSYLASIDVPIMTVNSDISAEQFARLGKPREKYKNWLAHFSPDDTLAGEQLASALLKQYRQQQCPQTSCQVNLFAITGLSYSAVSNQRANGLKQAVSADPKAQLLNTVYGNWDRNVVKSMARTIFTRHENINAFWVASDVMAYGLLDGMKDTGIAMPEGTIIGGMDWSPASVDLIRDNTMQMSLGGHFMEAGWAILLFHDYINGNDFVDETSTVIKTRMSLLNSSNVDKVGNFLANPQWSQARLREYSKVIHSQRDKYLLDPEKIILEQIDASEQ